MTAGIESHKYAFRLLSEEAIDNDLFEDKTHEQLADTLSNLIQRHEGKGQTIGVEGAWGSGKSTVVAILRKKLTEAGCRYFYFDAWAHEGDPLRRIFLESLVVNFRTFWKHLPPPILAATLVSALSRCLLCRPL